MWSLQAVLGLEPLSKENKALTGSAVLWICYKQEFSMPLIFQFLPVYPYNLEKKKINTGTKYVYHAVQLQAGKCKRHNGRRIVP